MVLPCTCDGPSVYLASPSRRPGTGAAATLFPPDRTDVPPACLPCTSGVTAVYPGMAGVRAGRAGLAPGSSAASGRGQLPVPRSRAAARDQRPAGPPRPGSPASHAADLYPRTGTGDAVMAAQRAEARRSPAAGSVTGVRPEGHLRYTAGIWSMVKGARPRHSHSSPARFTGRRGILVPAVPRKGAETGFRLVSAIPAAAGRSSPHAGFISLPGRIRRGSCHGQRNVTGAGSLPLPAMAAGRACR